MKSEAVIRCGVAFCVGTVITELALLVVIVANDGGSFKKFNPGVLASILWGIDPLELGKLEARRFEERSFDNVGLIEAVITPTDFFSSFIILPSGEIIALCPNVSLFFVFF